MRIASRTLTRLLPVALAALLVAAAGCSKDEAKSDTGSADTASADTGSTDTSTGSDTSGGTVDAGPRKDAVKLLVFSKTAGFRHDSIDAAKAALEGQAKAHDWTITATEDAATFSSDGLAGYDAVVFLMTTGDVLDAGQQDALKAYVEAGGGFVGIHSATDTEHDWDFFGTLVGARFKDHTSADTDGKAVVLDHAHPSTKDLPALWSRKEEWYNFKESPTGKVHVLVKVKDGAMGHDHPHAWCLPVSKGRSFYTAGGHSAAAWSEAEFLGHVAGGIDWASGRLGGDCGATIDSKWKRETVAEGLDAPMELEIASNGDAYVVQRKGKLLRLKKGASKFEDVGTLPVETAHEDGLLGLALDPDFASNQQIWLYHSIKSPSENRLSSFRLEGGKLDAASEKVALKIPVERALCCHSSGAVEFGPNRNLYLSTGDNTNPWSTGYAPIDGRKDKSGYDARRSAGNPDDLRGKILRVVAKADGSVEIPKDNLYPEGKGGRGEIFAIGVRNPFRMKVDAKTGRVWWCETGPDAKVDDADKGPQGYDEINFADGPGAYGWPFCIADNKAYGKVDFETDKASGKFDCKGPTNDSPNIAKSVKLPESRPATVWYPYNEEPAFPGIVPGGARTALFALIHRGAAAGVPPFFEGLPIYMDWSRSQFYGIHQGTDGKAVDVVRVWPKVEVVQPIDIDVGPDGVLYVLEWGKGWEGNQGARLSRLVYTP
ncbi:MAG: ThuA domain-containing protein [Deltaproteobacteria bacterium]|nr:ThuA domain-containing protein [Deltaproteobacteria bacterium]